MRAGSTELVQYRSPTQLEASRIFKIPHHTISDWIKNEEKIESHEPQSMVRSVRTVAVCQWPELESQLLDLFLEHRKSGQGVYRGWFGIHAYEMFRKLYPQLEIGFPSGVEPKATDLQSSILGFLNGWFQGFLTRYRISI